MKQHENILRNHGIDFLRGLCILGVLFHHTCLYSGNYVPLYVKFISFLLEVPAFMFVSGLTMKYTHKDMIINGTLKLSLSFTLLSIILNLISGTFTPVSVVAPLFFQGMHLSSYWNVLSGSYWFAPMYVFVVILATVILQKFYPIYSSIAIGCFLLYVLSFFNFLPASFLSAFSINFLYGDLWGKGMCFLLFFFLFGYWWEEHQKLHSYRQYIALILLIIIGILFVLMYAYQGNIVFNLWHYKDDKGLPYIVASLIGVAGFILIYKPQLHNSFLEYIGRYAIFYYIGQGLSSSCLKSVESYVELPWGYKLLCMFLLNIVLMVIFSEIFRLVYTAIGKIYFKIIHFLD